ncbi:MAG: complex I NDUFA9 subunit family protein [Alphaproteobacteria bacterium]|nr:complex I NDUFA9 subunit family protein [Alphaproteobacteria bacterium]MCB9928063.1 complex I NDUFA9 subunit family protein [Alphaproteobacteria bacterium]
MALARVVVFGGSGFIGRHVVQRLAAAGHPVRVACRDVEAAKTLKPMGAVGQISPVLTNIRYPETVAAACEGMDWVVNLVGILHESGAQQFDAVMTEGAEYVARYAAAAGAAKLVHVSAIGADAASESFYAQCKAAGEAAVRRVFPSATILRPSVVFGPEDDFFNRFADLARFSPILPLIDGGETRMQPVYVGDVADAICRTLSDDACAGETYELGGPRVMSLKEIMAYTLAITGMKRLLLPLPAPFAAIQARLFELLPNPPLTRDQLKLLATDNVVGTGAKGLEDLGITPTPVESVVPRYLGRFRGLQPSDSHGTAGPADA